MCLSGNVQYSNIEYSINDIFQIVVSVERMLLIHKKRKFIKVSFEIHDTKKCYLSLTAAKTNLKLKDNFMKIVSFSITNLGHVSEYIYSVLLKISRS